MVEVEYVQRETDYIFNRSQQREAKRIIMLNNNNINNIIDIVRACLLEPSLWFFTKTEQKGIENQLVLINLYENDLHLHVY